MFTHESESIVISNINCCIKTEGIIKVSVGHIHGKSGDISKMVQDTDAQMLLLQNTNRI